MRHKCSQNTQWVRNTERINSGLPDDKDYILNCYAKLLLIPINEYEIEVEWCHDLIFYVSNGLI